MKMPILLVAILLLLPPLPGRGAARADVAAAQVDVRDYAPGAIYPVRAALGITTRLELDPAEEILDFSIGFSEGWDLERRGSVFYLRPRDGDVDTNLLVRTGSRSYIFELKVAAADWTRLEQVRSAGVHYTVAFRYPADEAYAQEVDASAGAGQSTRLEPGRSYSFDYDIAARRAPPWLLPVNVYDDGRFTYLRMGTRAGGPSGIFPAVFGRRRRDGEEFVVNTTAEGDVLVVHGIYPFLVIRHGGDVVGVRRNAR